MSQDKTPHGDYDVPDRSTVSPDDFIEHRKSVLICTDCDTDMNPESKTEWVECECGHEWQVRCRPTQNEIN